MDNLTTDTDAINHDCFEPREGEYGNLIPVEVAHERISIRPDMAQLWIDMVKCDDDDENGGYVSERYISVFDEPQYVIIKDHLNLFFLPLEFLDIGVFFDVMFGNVPFVEDHIAKYRHSTTMDKLSLFPGDNDDRVVTIGEDKLLKLSQAARLLSIPESKLRSLASQGLIESTKSQGDTGHHRFKPEWIREFLAADENH